jgi:thioredoxin reductase (NADPH)
MLLEILMGTIYTLAIFSVLLGVIAIPYWMRVARERQKAEEQFMKSQKAGSLMPVTLHPHIDRTECIGCGSCVQVCPEDVLGLVGGRASVISGMRCIGHGLCADVCPVGAIVLRFGTPKEGQEIPRYDKNFETDVKGVYVVGELGGIGLIRNAVSQSMQAIRHITSTGKRAKGKGMYDVLVIGAGPAGLSAALAAQANGLTSIVLEQDSIGGTIYHYPRQKLVLTIPVELPLYGKLDATEITKEELLAVWQTIVQMFSLPILVGKKVDSIDRTPDGFVLKSGTESWMGRNIVMALGRRGSPRKLGVPGEDLPKVAYKLQEAESYQNKKILIVGGGDSAIEAAVALSRQKGNEVVLSYRREVFVRIKEKNETNIADLIRSRKIKAFMSSSVEEITQDAVTLQLADKTKQSLENDFVFVFAGGDAPTELPRKAGVQFRTAEN